MSSGSFGVSTNNSHIVGVVNWSESGQNSANDTSNVYAEMRLWRNNTGYTSYGTDDFWVGINGTYIHSGQISYSLTYNSNTLMVSGTVPVTHNPDGSKSITIEWGGGGGANGVFTVNYGSGTATLDTIPRASTVASSVSWTAGTQDLSVSLNVADSSFHHNLDLYIQHTYDGNYDYIGRRSNIGTSTVWQFTQSEITQIYTTNNAYENRPVILRVWTYDSSGNQVGNYQDTGGTVYAIPTATITVNSNNTFNIGDSPSYSLNNYTSGSAGGFTYDLVITVGSFTKTISGTTAQTGNLSFTTADINSMYAQTPNANSVSGTIRVRTYYNGVSTEDSNPATDATNITLNVVNSNPTFGTGYTYADTNTTVTNITGSSSYIVQNQSSLTVTLPKANAATAVNAASMSYYNFTAANASATMYVPTAAPTLATATTGGSLAAGTYYVVYTWVNAAGESFSSPETSITVPSGTTTNTITVTLPSFPTGITSANIYMSTSTGTETKQANSTSTSYTRTAALVAGSALPSMTINLGTINASANTNLQVKAVDSRGNYTTTSISVNIVPYSAPVVNATAARNNGFDTSTVLTLSGSASAVSISGATKNSIVSAQYQVRQKGGTFGSLSNFTISGFPNYSATNVTLTLDNTLAWDINFVVTDKFGNTSVIQSVTAGTPLLSIDSVKKSIGINKLPTGAGGLETSSLVIAPIGYSGYINASSNSNYWGRIGVATITAQYQDATAVTEIVSNGTGTGVVSTAKVVWKVKQQNPMGQAPVISVVVNFPGTFSPTDFVAVMTTNSTSSTVVEFWARAQSGYDSLVYTVLSSSGGNLIAWDYSYNAVSAYTAGISTTVGADNLINPIYTYNGKNQLLQVEAGGGGLLGTPDFNTMMNTGLFRMNTATNAPVISPVNPDQSKGWWYLQVIRHDSSWGLQIAYDYRDGTYLRRWWNNNGTVTWDTWRRITDERRDILAAEGTNGQNLSPSTWSRAQWDSPWANQGVIWQPGGNANMFAVKESGWYEIFYSVQLQQSINTAFYAQLWGNPSAVGIVSQWTTNNGWNTMSSEVVANLNPNINYEIVLRQEDGGYTRGIDHQKMRIYRI